MKYINHIFIFVIGIMLVVILVQLFFLNQLSKIPLNKQPVSQINAPPPRDIALNYPLLIRLSRFPEGTVSSAVINLEYKGLITDIDTEGGVLSNGFTYIVKLTLEENTKAIVLYLGTEDIKKIEFFGYTENKEEINDLKDLSIGDKITVRETIDMTRNLNNNLIGMQISRL